MNLPTAAVSDTLRSQQLQKPHISTRRANLSRTTNSLTLKHPFSTLKPLASGFMKIPRRAGPVGLGKLCLIQVRSVGVIPKPPLCCAAGYCALTIVIPQVDLCCPASRIHIHFISCPLNEWCCCVFSLLLYYKCVSSPRVPIIPNDGQYSRNDMFMSAPYP